MRLLGVPAAPAITSAIVLGDRDTFQMIWIDAGAISAKMVKRFWQPSVTA
jgi:hypothetical protein